MRFRTGSIAVMPALVCASLLALVIHARSPLEPVADQIMNLTPVPIAVDLLLRLGALSRFLAMLGAVAVSLAWGGFLAVLFPYPLPPGQERRGLAPAVVLRALLAVALWLGALALLGGDPGVQALLALVYVLGLLLFGQPWAYSSSRRAFLVQNAGVWGGIAALGLLLYLGPVVDAFETRAAGRRLFPWAPPRPRKPGFAIAGLTPEVTPPGAFYTMDEDMAQPDIDLLTWTLSVEGMVDRPLQLSFSDLLAFRRRDEIVTQECVSNPVGGPLMSTALFSGVPVGDVLRRAGIQPGASAVLFAAPDGHEEAIPLGLALDHRVLLVYAKDGRFLEREHGFPLRLLVPGFYGFKSVKWVGRVRVTADPRAGYWERNGWSPLPQVHTTARIDLARPTSAGLLVAGVAFAGHRGIRKVQVRANGGPWHDAELHVPALSPLTWVQWRAVLPLRGRLTLEARAMDGAGVLQTATRHTQKPDGATGYHSVTVDV